MNVVSATSLLRGNWSMITVLGESFVAWLVPTLLALFGLAPEVRDVVKFILFTIDGLCRREILLWTANRKTLPLSIIQYTANINAVFDPSTLLAPATMNRIIL